MDSSSCGMQHAKTSVALGENVWDLEKLAHTRNRASMITLSRWFGWSGLHFFIFGKPFLGGLHLLLSLTGILGAASLFFILMLADNPERYLYIAMCLIPALPVAVLSGLVCSFYWMLHDDEYFAQVYPNKKAQDIKSVDISENK